MFPDGLSGIWYNPVEAGAYFHRNFRELAANTVFRRASSIQRLRYKLIFNVEINIIPAFWRRNPDLSITLTSIRLFNQV
jgi:hypothetical protein